MSEEIKPDVIGEDDAALKSPLVPSPFNPPFQGAFPPSGPATLPPAPPIPEEQPKRGPGRPRKVVDLEEELKADPLNPDGTSFFFGEIGLLKFADKTEYHIQGHRAKITDPKLIANIKEAAAKNPALKIFQDEPQ